ncbi:DUF4942 domain-containing protein [Enterococcus wangshanyuanii]|uniref:DUF4942 domain-containing protein n=2 Tax=Enterococcus wangshanyuanii TaxID=2005703 RepID=A0ABQ1PVB7_9ENTE|nr:DUF4942 domain-containing protein [Enterococcus wangshanyuanii]GGD04299.1 hypothetical protein GCM10011573_37290 [Enterococcus wangshanyuanii]
MLKDRLKRERYKDPNPVFDLLCNDLKHLNSGSNKVLIPDADLGELALSSMKFRYGVKEEYALLEKDFEKSNNLENQGFEVVGTDFLTFATHIEFDIILLDPPVEKSEDYLLKAFELAQKQVDKSCYISALIRADIIQNPSTALQAALENNETEITFHKNVKPESKEEVALVRVSVTKATDNVHKIYDRLLATKGFEPAQTALERGLSTIVSDRDLEERLKDIRFLISSYNEHISLLKKKYLFDNSLNMFESIMKQKHKFGSFSYRRNDLTLNQEIKSIRSQYWEKILKTDEFRKKLTRHGSSLITDKIDSATKLEITEENVLLLLTALMSNGYEVILDSCVEWFKKMTGNHQNEYSKNIHYYNGFKTNDAFKVNSKIIIPAYQASSYYETVSFGYGHPLEENFKHITHGMQDYMNDLITMFKLIKPDIPTTFTANDYGDLENEFLRFKVFKKGTIHIWFKDLETLDKFNLICGQKFGWVPSSEEMKQDPEALRFAKNEFPNIQNLLN